jgi:pimeloyl-ACP methyl ester carboxylesterase
MIGLLGSLGVGRAVFVGTSMGGLITMLAAAQAPQLLAGAVLNDVGPEIDPVGLARILGYAGVAKTAATWAEAAELSRAVNGAAFPDEHGEAFWAAVARRTFRERAPGEIVLDYDPRIARPAPPDAGPPPELWPLFDALSSIPALVIRGELSDVLMASTVAEMRRRKPDLIFASTPRVGHAPFMTEPGAWTALSAFLESAAL